MSAYSSSLRKPLVRNHSALRSEYSDAMMKNSGRVDNRLQEQYKELERARKVIEADLRQQKSAIAATYNPSRRSSCPSMHHAKIHSKLIAEKASADERLNNFLSHSMTRSRSDKAVTGEDGGETGGHQVTDRARLRTGPSRLTSYHSAPEITSGAVSRGKLREYSTYHRGKVPLDEGDEDEEDVESVQKQRAERKKSRERFFSNLSKPKHPVQDKKALRAKIETDLETTRKVHRRRPKSHTVSNCTSDVSY